MPNKQIIQNSIFGVTQYILTALLTLISVPIFINSLGLELYGIFAVVSVVGNLNLLTNFGLNGTLLIFISKQGKSRESDHDIIVTFIILGAILTLFSLISIYFSDFIVRSIFQIPAIHLVESKHLLIYLVIANAILLIGQTYTSVLDALQKIHITNIYQFFYSLIYWGGMIIVVTMSKNLSNVGLIAVVASLIWFIGVAVNTHYIWGKLDFRGLKSNFLRISKKQLTYGSQIYASGLVAFLFEPLSKILLSNFVGLNAVGLFEIGIKIRSQISGIMSKALYPLFPYIAKTPSSSTLHRRIFDFSKKIEVIVVPASILSLFVLPILLKLWLGENHLHETTIFVTTLTISLLLFSAPIIPIYQYLNAKGLALKNIWMQGMAVIVNILFFFLLKDVFHHYAIIISNTIAYLASYLVGAYYQSVYLTGFRKDSRKHYFDLFAYTVISIFFCFWIQKFVVFGITDLVIYPSVVVALFILYNRNRIIISRDDLATYFGHETFLKRILTFLLIQKHKNDFNPLSKIDRRV